MPDRQELQRLLHLAGSAIVVFVGGLYVVGLLIVNVYLGFYGLTSISLARAEYVLVGSIWAILTICGMGGIDLVGSRWRRHKVSRWSVADRILFAGLQVIAVSLCIFTLFMLFSRAQVALAFTSISVIVVIFLNGAFVTLLWASLRSVYSERPGSLGSIYDPSGWFPWVPSYFHVGVAGLFAIVSYAAAVFPSITPTFGGGLKPAVHLLLADPSEDWVSDSGLPLLDDGRSIGPVFVLTEADSFVFVKAFEEKMTLRMWWLGEKKKRREAIAIDKKKITAIRYLRGYPDN